MSAVKLIQVGNSVGLILPEAQLSRLRLQKGDTVFIAESPDGLTLTPFDPELNEQVEAGRAFMREFRDTFHQLAR